jgi:predicted nucleic acid-binding protein
VALAGPVFIDTSVLIAGLIEIGATSPSSSKLLQAVSRGRVSRPITAWHCCLEFYSVSTRLPLEARLTPPEAWRLLEANVFGRIRVVHLPRRRQVPFLSAAAADGIGGGRIYDAHIAQTARAAGAKTIVTDNQRHFSPLVGRAITLLTSDEAAARL